MKQLFIIFCITALSLNGFSQTNESKVEDKKAPIMTFENITYNFGEIEKNSEAICVFKFSNTGKSPLILQQVRSSCGCTVPSWSKEPIKKGKEGEITVKYNTSSVKSFTKSITVNSNAKNTPVRLTITGKVIEAKENPKTKAAIQRAASTRKSKPTKK